MAWALMNPDYEVSFPDTPPSGTPEFTLIPVNVLPVPWEITEVDRPIARKHEIQVNNVIGEISGAMPGGRTGTSLAFERYSAGTGRSRQARQEVEKLLTRLDDEHFMVTVIAELSEPMSEAQLERTGLSASTILLDARRGKKPFGWKAANCETLEMSGCADLSVLEGFRRWSASLRPEDEKALGAWGLSGDRLRAIARDGKVSGLMADLTSPSGALSFVRNDRVRAVYVAAVLLRQPVPR
ncbi:hypothetical protein HII36_05080 [Nonomuraea sp. NN258]|uniref:hypothetical protein n=1 Tax=Nonomuraea antri TaxID=2730852 RepID=UPI001568585E|nr:hypothetical protein [Nonomuraea antri]NRQ31209.1 hypothetical protein [Nonomuraea antri]